MRKVTTISAVNQMNDYSWNNAPLEKQLTSDEVGNAAAFLASPLSSAITGSVIYVDNGLHSMGVGIDSPLLKTHFLKEVHGTRVWSDLLWC
ncbi:enoyl-[acyl-carrier-protein] reductase [nadh] chloroplastic [Phtheirospermum japonicum]|uniref:Enoyl-[acyl-carrier-protein] reductase [nadh] chloroplastic n=1 Tax=Phtheirospermum japonicum TaxID=374723 RepID=A0A830CB92_9LAMI|nr:enoyl-[acyl-carrier-protein] reductase [nadh] chloroplastic [Phtheirospermum japonicum]